MNAIFPRDAEAAKLTSRLLGTDPLSGAGRSGLFLAAPRRTGKSTFLRNDLLPTVERAGGFPLYVDLWSDKSRDPGELIAEAIREGLRRAAGPVRGLSKWMEGIRKLKIEGKFAAYEAALGFEIETVGRPEGTTLAKALQALHATVGKPIVFAIDEAQHALMTEEGSNALFALKAARDALNLTAQTPQLAILATGSLRGKLSNLVMRKDQAFYGAIVEDLPRLGKEFVVSLAQQMLGHRLTAETMPKPEKLEAAFQMLHSRPEEMRRAIESAVTRPERDIGDAILAAAAQRRAELLHEAQAQLQSLEPLQRALLEELAVAEAGTAAYSLYSAESVANLQNVLGRPVSRAQIQNAANALVKHGLIWRSARGVYAVDDHAVADYVWQAGEAELREFGIEFADEDGRLDADEHNDGERGLDVPRG